MQNENLIRSLNFKEALALVVGTVIGTGVFLKAAIMSQQTGSPTWVLVSWGFAGLLSLIGALCYSELGGLFPKAGGEYVFLREGYGDLVAFLYGWMRFWIGTPGSIAAYGVGAATFLKALFDIDNPSLVAVGFIAFFSTLNCFSVAIGGRVQAFITFLKVFMILGLVAAIFVFGRETGRWEHLVSAPGTGEWKGWSIFGAATLAALWAYDGWNNMPMAAGEVKNPGRVIPLALSLGMAGVLLIYVLANLSYFYALPFGEVLTAYSKNNPNAAPIATKAASAILGGGASIALSVAFVVSALGAMNGSILTGARVPFAMARDGLFFKALGEINKNAHVPVVAVIVQGAIAGLLALSGSFDQLTDYVVFAAWIFYALCTASILIFRRKIPQAERPFKVPFYPVLPIVFVTLSVLLLINTLVTSPRESGVGLVLILIGIPVFMIFKRKKAAA